MSIEINEVYPQVIEKQPVQEITETLQPDTVHFLNRLVKGLALKTIQAEAELAKTLEVKDFLEFFPEHERGYIQRFVETFPIIPRRDMIIVKVLPHREIKTAAGVALPESSKETMLQGIVLAAGPGWTDAQGNFHYNDIRVGHHVLFHDLAGTDVRFGNTSVLMREMSARDVTAVVRNTTALERAEVSYE